ncbi:hypothetical protein TNCV_4409411 [Trichonephila clavipes]|nr:hypothetical protein TNCV_4409411 [Trichonephila clavipes]
MTSTAGSDVVQSGRPIFEDFSQHLWPYIGNNTANVVFQNGQAFVAYPHRPMTLHSPTENSLAVLKPQHLGGHFTGPKREIRRSPNVSFNKSIVARAV